jgi:predicted transcriptional regulator
MAPSMTTRPNASRQSRPARAHTTSTVRVKLHVHATLQALAEEMNEPIQDVIEEAVERFRRQRMVELHNQAYAALKSDPDAWRAELAERAEWDAALADGLEREGV